MYPTSKSQRKLVAGNTQASSATKKVETANKEVRLAAARELVRKVPDQPDAWVARYHDISEEEVMELRRPPPNTYE